MIEWAYISTKKKITKGELWLLIELIENPPFDPPTLFPELVKISEFSLGSDEDSDLINLPGEVSVELFFYEDTKDTIELLQYLQQKISSEFINVYFYLNSELIFQGYIDPSTDRLKLNEDKKTIQLSILDQTLRIRDLDPKTNPFNYPNLNDNRKIIDLIQDFFINNIFGYDNYILGLEQYSTIEAQAIIGSNYITFFFDQLYANLNFYYRPLGAGYDRLIDVLKSILINYNLIAYIGFDRKLYLIPRFDGLNEIFEVQKYNLIDKPEYKITDKIDGVKVHVWKGSHPKENNYYIYTLGNYTDGDNNSEELFIDQPCGSFPGGSYSGIAVIYNSQYYWIEPDRVRYKKRDDSYSGYNSLYKLVADDNWDKIKFPRLKCEIEVDGIFDKWTPKYAYKLFNSDILFRASKFKYDIIKNKTRISMRQIGIVPVDYRLLEDGYYRLVESSSYRLLEFAVGSQTQDIFYRITEDNNDRILEDGNKRII